jgi:hypothetical protein
MINGWLRIDSGENGANNVAPFRPSPVHLADVHGEGFT